MDAGLAEAGGEAAWRRDAGRATHRLGICTSKTSKHSPHCTLVRACFSTAWSRAPQEGQENWYVDSAILREVAGARICPARFERREGTGCQATVQQGTGRRRAPFGRCVRHGDARGRGCCRHHRLCGSRGTWESGGATLVWPESENGGQGEYLFCPAPPPPQSTVGPQACRRGSSSASLDDDQRHAGTHSYFLCSCR